MSAPRILHLMAAVAPNYGGPSAAIWPMLAALAEAGADVELVTTDAAGPHQRWPREEMPSVAFPIHVVPGSRETPAYIGRWVGSNVRAYDVLHTHGLWHRHGSAAMAAARAAGVPHVIRTCGMLSPYSWKRRWWKKRPYWWLVERRNVRAAAALHVTSPGERAEVAAWHLPAPVHEIPLGVDVAASETPRNEDYLRNRCGPAAGDRPIVLFLGRLHPVKGIAACLLPALARVETDCFLAIAGGAAADVPGYETEIRSTAARLGLSDRIALLGAVTGTEKWACYDGASVTVLPSLTESFGLTVVEAMARGCPVVVTEGVQSRSIVEEAGAGWVVPFDPMRLGRALEAALTDPTGARFRGLAGQAFVKRELTWDRAARSLMSLYDAVAR